MPISDKESRGLFKNIGILIEKCKNLENGQQEIRDDFKNHVLEFKKEVRENNITKGERKYIYGTMGFLFIILGVLIQITSK